MSSGAAILNRIHFSQSTEVANFHRVIVRVRMQTILPVASTADILGGICDLVLSVEKPRAARRLDDFADAGHAQRKQPPKTPLGIRSWFFVLS